MGAVKDTYDIIKDLLKEAKKLRNNDFVEKVLDIQQSFFDLRNQNQQLKEKIIEQEKHINQLANIQKELEALKDENVQLKVKLASYEKAEDLSFLDQVITCEYTEKHVVYYSDMPASIVNKTNETLKEIYMSIAPKLLTPKNDKDFDTLFEKNVNGTYSYLDEKSVGKIKAKFLQHNLIEINNAIKGKVELQLTEIGRQVLNKLNDI